MTDHLDHLLVPSANRDAAAKQLAELLGVQWGAAAVGPFTSVYLNDGLTIDFDQWTEAFQKGYYCFRVTEPQFDIVLDRIQKAGLPYRSTPHGPMDWTVNTSHGGRIVYWGVPDGHVWELLTHSYARHSPGPQGAA